MITFLAIIYGIASAFLVIFILLQAGKGAGMGIFGGGGSSTTFGAQGGDVLTRITTVLGIVFFGVALIIALMVSRDRTASSSWAEEGSGQQKNEQIVAPGYAEKTNQNQTNQESGAGAGEATDEAVQTVPAATNEDMLPIDTNMTP